MLKITAAAAAFALATPGSTCKVTPSGGGSAPSCPELQAEVAYVCQPNQVLRCVPMQYWLEDTACAASLDAAAPTGVLGDAGNCWVRPSCSESGTNLKFVLSCVNLNTPCGSLISSPAFSPIQTEICGAQ
jgi:hypothetical protein